MASHRHGAAWPGCCLSLAVLVAAFGAANSAFSLLSGPSFRVTLFPRPGDSRWLPEVARPAEDRFAQRGGIAAADLQEHKPEVTDGGYAREPRPAKFRQPKPGYQRDNGRSRGRKTFKSSRYDEEDEANLTKEEREERFREQIQSPVTLTTFIKRAETPEEFMWTVWTAMDETMLNHIHLAAAFTRLAALKKKAAPFKDRIRKSPLLVELAKQAARVADRREFKARELANMLIAAASLRTELPWIGEILGVPLAKWVPENVKTMTPQAFANTMYGLGVLDLGDEQEVVEAMRSCAKVIPIQMGRFSAMDIAQVAWGLGARGSPEEAGELLDAIEQWVLKEAQFLKRESALLDLPMIALAFARLGDWRPKMMDAIARRIYPVLEDLRLWSLAALLWVWGHPSSPWQGQSEMHAQFPKLIAGKGGFDQDTLARLFLGRLKKSSVRRKITEEDIQRAPMGPKGETSSIWSGSFWKSDPAPPALEGSAPATTPALNA